MNFGKLELEQKLRLWRDLRTQIQNMNCAQAVATSWQFFSQITTCAYWLDRIEIQDWPDIWEIIDRRDLCSTGVMAIMLATLQMMFPQQQFEICYVRDHQNHERSWVLFFQDQIYGFLSHNRLEDLNHYTVEQRVVFKENKFYIK